MGLCKSPLVAWPRLGSQTNLATDSASARNPSWRQDAPGDGPAPTWAHILAARRGRKRRRAPYKLPMHPAPLGIPHRIPLGNSPGNRLGNTQRNTLGTLEGIQSAVPSSFLRGIFQSKDRQKPAENDYYVVLLVIPGIWLDFSAWLRLLGFALKS